MRLRPQGGDANQRPGKKQWFCPKFNPQRRRGIGLLADPRNRLQSEEGNRTVITGEYEFGNLVKAA